MLMQRALRLIYPPECLICRASTESEFGLCGPCWRDMPFIAGSVCHQCGTPVLGDAQGPDVLCEECFVIARPWAMARAAVSYDGNGRRMVLGIKYGDRADLVKPAAIWMAQAAAPMLTDQTLLVPVPLHWTRLVQRRFNQAAMLARAVADQTGCEVCPDALIRPDRTGSTRGQSRDMRFASLYNAIRPHPKRGDLMQDRDVMLVDDVMTTGATLAACCEAAHSAGARQVTVLLLARAGRDT